MGIHLQHYKAYLATLITNLFINTSILTLLIRKQALSPSVTDKTDGDLSPSLLCLIPLNEQF